MWPNSDSIQVWSMGVPGRPDLRDPGTAGNALVIFAVICGPLSIGQEGEQHGQLVVVGHDAGRDRRAG